MWLAEILFGHSRPAPPPALLACADAAPTPEPPADSDGVASDDCADSGAALEPVLSCCASGARSAPALSDSAAVPVAGSAPALIPGAGDNPRRAGWLLRPNYKPPEHHSPRAHAQQILAWLQTGDKRGRSGDILHPEMLEIHSDMCAELNWAMRPWDPIGAELRRLTTGDHKPYVWVRENGVKRRLRVYPIPGVTPSNIIELRSGASNEEPSAVPEQERRAA